MGAYVNGRKTITADEVTAVDLFTTGKVYLGDTNAVAPVADGGLWISGTGDFGKGLILNAAPWCPSLLTLPTGGFGTPSIGIGDFLLSGGTYPVEFTATTQTGGWTFAAGDEGKVIILLSGTHAGALAMVEEIISTTVVTLETCDWDADFTGISFMMLNIPVTFTSRARKINIIPPTGEWENVANLHTGEYASKFKLIAAADGVTSMDIDTEGMGYTNIDTLHITHATGALASGSIQKATRVEIDDSLCIGGTTTEVDGVKYTRTKGNSIATVCAIDIGTAFTNAMKIDGSPPENPGYGYTFTNAFAVTDHVNSGGGGNDSFINPAVNTQMFTADNTGILIGFDSKFSVIQYVQSIAGSATITPTWQYSTGDGTWATLTVTDTTGGMRFSGKVSFAAPAAWAKSESAGSVGVGAITSAFYVRITRTANSLATPPTEQYFKVYQGASLTDTLIRGDGTYKPAQMIDGAAPNDSIYVSLTTATSGMLVYKDGIGGVNRLY